MLELLEILFENHPCEKVYLNKDHNQSINQEICSGGKCMTVIVKR